MDRDRLGRAFTALVDRFALGEAARERWYQDHVTAGFLRLEHDGVRPHLVILAQGRSEFIGGNSRLSQDRLQDAGSDRLAGVQGDRDSATTLWVPQLHVGASLSHDFPSKLPSTL